MSEPESRFYQSARLRLHYAVWGDEAKPPLILVHGGRDHGRSWDFVATALTDRFAVYAPDLRGHGDSDWAVGGQYRLSDHVADLAALVEAIDRGPVRLVGHSLGGRVVLDYAAIFPERVAGLVSIEGFGWRFSRSEPANERLRKFVEDVRGLERREPRVYATLDAAQARMQEANRRLTPAIARHLTEHALRRREEGGYVWKFDNFVRLRSLGEWSVEETKTIWQGIRAPLLLVGGSESGLRPAETVEGLSVEPVVVDGAGHWVHHDQLDRFVALVRDFFAD